MTQYSLDRQVLLLDASFSDAEHLCEAVQSWQFDFHPLSGEPGSDTELRVQQFVAGGIDHGYARFTTAINQAGAPPPAKLTFTILGENLRQLWWRGHHVDAGSVLVFPRNSELHSVSGNDFETDVLSVSDDILAAICERNELALPTTSLLGEVFRPPPHVLCRVRAMLRSVRTADARIGTADYVQIIQTLLNAWYKTDRRAVLGNVRGLRNRDRAVRLCLDAIDGSGLANLNAADLCDLTGVSARTLEYAFRERFNLGPAAFVRARRMLAVRKALSNAAPDHPGVGDTAARFGFCHSGQFAKDYRSRFGEPPSKTLTRDAGAGGRA